MYCLFKNRFCKSLSVIHRLKFVLFHTNFNDILKKKK